MEPEKTFESRLIGWALYALAFLASLSIFFGFRAASRRLLIWFPWLPTWFLYPACVGMYVVLILLGFRSLGEPRLTWRARLVGVSALLALVALLLRGLFTIASELAEGLRVLPALVVAPAILFAAILLFALRYARRAVYGVLEVAVGVIVGTSKFPNQPDTFDSGWHAVQAALAVLCAGVYLVIRGLDNIHVGLTKAPHDPWGLAVYRALFGDGNSHGRHTPVPQALEHSTESSGRRPLPSSDGPPRKP